MLRKAMNLSPMLVALAIFALSLGIVPMSTTPAEAQQVASGASDAETGSCTCPDWNGCICIKLE